MHHIQAGVSDEALVTAIRANMCDFFRHLSRSKPAEHFENKHFTRWYSLLPHPLFNGALCSKVYKEGDESFIHDTIEYFRGKGTRPFTCWVEPHLKPSAWEPAPARHGVGFSNDEPGIAVDLHEMNESMHSPYGSETHVVPDEESPYRWANTFSHGYGLP